MSSHGTTEYLARDSIDGRPDFVMCNECKRLYSVAAGADGRKSERTVSSAMEMAADCKHGITEAPSQERKEKSLEARLSKATKVTNLDYCFGVDGGDFYNDVESAADAGETHVYGATFMPYQINIDRIIEGVLEDHHEDASESDLIGLDAVVEAMEEFNRIQTSGSYEQDRSQYQEIEQVQTFAMIKPDATARGVEGDMVSYIEQHGFRVIEKRRTTLERDEAEWLYSEHAGREHFTGLVDYTISGEVILLRLEGNGSRTATDFRALMGPTDRTKAEPHTLRARYAVGYRENSIHGSDSEAAATRELRYFFED